MGPSFGLIVLLFVVLAALIFLPLLLMRGWKSLGALSAIYLAVLLYLSLTPAIIAGQVDRAVLGLAWVVTVLSIIARALMLWRRYRTSV
jgi:hypothetical protein